MSINRAIDREWAATTYQVIEWALFRNNQHGGRALFVQLVAGTHFS